MTDIKTKIDEEENKQFRSIPAQRLIEKLSLLKNRVNEGKKRWFWELLQNASDYNEAVNVKLVVTDDKVVFAHDGAPFSKRDALNLISPDSNKLDDEVHTDNIGKFGTGLVSTHILSAVMEVEGFCIDDDLGCYKFILSLDRSSFKNKQELIEQITQAKESFKQSLQKQDPQPGFNTSFSYRLGKPLPELPALSSCDVNLNYLYEVLPYTLCFMPKVKSVIIEDQRNQCETKRFKISRAQEGDDHNIVFTIEADQTKTTQQYAYISYGDVATTFRYEGDTILPFPKELSRIFCGLPLIGTEEIGMPFLLNSMKFTPTTEREGIELEPSSNDSNRKLFTDSIKLYGLLLDYVANNKLKNAFYLTRLRDKYNGTQISNQQFYSLYLAQYKQQVLSHNIVINMDNEFISFSSMRLPFKDSKPNLGLYKNSQMLNKIRLPRECDYEQWFDAIDFNLFRDQKFTNEDFAQQIQSKSSIFTFGQSPEEVLEWLFQCASYFKESDNFLLSRYKVLPNQSGNLCTISSDLYADNDLPIELKELYDTLYASNYQKIGDKLLNKDFNELGLLYQEYTLEMLSRKIDTELSSQYSKNQGNTHILSTSINKLYNWINKTEIAKEDLASYFRWYYPKRATLIVDMLSEIQREQALVIAQSGMMEPLSVLASSNLTQEEMQLIVANIKRLPDALSLLTNTIDDKKFADATEGDFGEEIVYKDLIAKYPKVKGYNVCWASKEKGECCYDFEITHNGQPFCYCDAKTTRKGIANADSIPFFMRKSQWNFLHSLSETTPYYIARVFMNDGGAIKYIRITETNI